MGYFSNGNEGEAYQEAYCNHCVHDQKFQQTLDADDGCAVWLAHVIHMSDSVNKPDNLLDLLIPRTPDGLGNEQCRMFLPMPDDE